MATAGFNTSDTWLEPPVNNTEHLSSGSYIACGIYLSAVGIGATVCNAFTLAMFLRNKALRKKPHNLLLINLAIADMGISIFGYPLTTASFFAQRWLWGSIGCQMQGFVTFCLAVTSMLTMTVISVYRYIALCRPQYNHRLTQRITKLVIGGVWSYSFVVTTPPLIGWTSYTYEPYGTACTIDWTNPAPESIAYNVYCILTCYVTTVSVMLFCYTKVVCRLNGLSLTVKTAQRHHVTLKEAEMLHRMAAEGKVTRVTVFMVVTFIIVWSPYAWVGLWSMMAGGVPMWLKILPSMLAKSTCLLNPIFFIFTSSFRYYISSCFKRRKRIQHFQRPSILGGSDVFMVNRTDHGIYIGDNKIQLRPAETSMF